MTRMLGIGGSLALLVALGSGCVLEPKEDAGKFREAIPRAEAVQVSGPESTQSSNTASYDGLAGVKADEPWAQGPWSHWYGFTRHVRSGVNKLTGAVLGSVWLIVHTKPTTLTDDEAIWGPYTDALEPVTYRLRVTEVAADTYEYRLEGRPKASTDDGDYVAVLSGKGFGRDHSSHGDGSFTIDIDAMRQLDPFAVDPKDTGKVIITHDLPSTITTDLFVGARSVKAEALPSHTAERWTALSKTEEDGSGTLQVDALTDVDDLPGTELETVAVYSMWLPSGAGRADISIMEGDVPADLGSVHVTECWSDVFQTVYVGYSDNVTWATAEGSADACVQKTPVGG